MEAAICQKKGIALSFGFFSRNHDPEIIAGACRHSVKLIEYLYKNWDSDVNVYSINVPVVAGVEEHKTVIAQCFQNYWTTGSCFEEIDATDEDEDPQIQEMEIRERYEAPGSNEQPARHKHRHFKWAPKFDDVQKAVLESPPGNDGWALGQGYTRLFASHAYASEPSLTALQRHSTES